MGKTAPKITFKHSPDGEYVLWYRVSAVWIPLGSKDTTSLNWAVDTIRFITVRYRHEKWRATKVPCWFIGGKDDVPDPVL